MAQVWRLTAPEYATRLDGKGNVERGARWNSPGRGVVYASFNLSLAVLETLVQLVPELRRALPEMAATRIEIPEEAANAKVNRAEFPTDFTTETAARRCREIGDAWLAAEEHVGLVVPSVIVPHEQNLLINPTHSLMREVKIIAIEPFRFDPRLAAGPA